MGLIYFVLLFVASGLIAVVKEMSKSKQTTVSAGREGKERRETRKRSRSRSSSASRSTTSSSSSNKSSSAGRHGRDRSRSRSSRRHHRRSRSRSGSRGRRPQDRRSGDRRGTSRGSYEARGPVKKKELSSSKTRTSDFSAAFTAAAATSVDDSKTSVTKPIVSATAERMPKSAALSSVKPASSTFTPVAASQAEVPQITHPTAAVAAGGTADSVQQMLKTPPMMPASETNTASKFSRDSIVRSLNEMVSVPDSSRTAEDVELVEKQRSAFEFAISMYMAATEFYDGGSLWCRQCDCIFTDISALCRHIHSDKHQLVSSALLLTYILQIY